jgi:hypothetical protein
MSTGALEYLERVIVDDNTCTRDMVLESRSGIFELMLSNNITYGLDNLGT